MKTAKNKMLLEIIIAMNVLHARGNQSLFTLRADGTFAELSQGLSNSKKYINNTPINCIIIIIIIIIVTVTVTVTITSTSTTTITITITIIIAVIISSILVDHIL